MIVLYLTLTENMPPNCLPIYWKLSTTSVLDYDMMFWVDLRVTYRHFPGTGSRLLTADSISSSGRVSMFMARKIPTSQLSWGNSAAGLK